MLGTIYDSRHAEQISSVVSLLSHNHTELGSNIGRDILTILTVCFVCFLSPSGKNAKISTFNKGPLIFISFPVHSSLPSNHSKLQSLSC